MSLVPGGAWSRGGVPGLGVYLVQGGVYLVRGVGVPRPGVYLVRGGVPGSGGVPGPGGCTWSGVCTWSGTPPVNRITHTRKNITLPQLRCGW